jgi:hypothetical protein
MSKFDGEHEIKNLTRQSIPGTEWHTFIVFHYSTECTTVGVLNLLFIDEESSLLWRTVHSLCVLFYKPPKCVYSATLKK